MWKSPLMGWGTSTCSGPSVGHSQEKWCTGAGAGLSAGPQKVWEVAQDALIPYFSFFTESLICVADKAALQIRNSCYFFKYLSTHYVGSVPLMILMVVTCLQNLGHLTQCSSISSSSWMVNWKYKSVWTSAWAGGKGGGSVLLAWLLLLGPWESSPVQMQIFRSAMTQNREISMDFSLL